MVSALTRRTWYRSSSLPLNEMPTQHSRHDLFTHLTSSCLRRNHFPSVRSRRKSVSRKKVERRRRSKRDVSAVLDVDGE